MAIPAVGRFFLAASAATAITTASALSGLLPSLALRSSFGSIRTFPSGVGRHRFCVHINDPVLVVGNHGGVRLQPICLFVPVEASDGSLNHPAKSPEIHVVRPAFSEDDSSGCSHLNCSHAFNQRTSESSLGGLGERSMNLGQDSLDVWMAEHVRSHREHGAEVFVIVGRASMASLATWNGHQVARAQVTPGSWGPKGGGSATPFHPDDSSKE